MKFLLLTALASSALGYGMITAALHFPAAADPQCGTEQEDPKECSREGLQGRDRGSGRGPVVSGEDCPKGSRDCFPEDRVPWAKLSRLIG
jgi:hypothetical protein